MTAVGGRLASAELRYDEVIAGRLLRVQVRHSCLLVPLEVINIYQKTCDQSGSDSASAVREHVWQSLHRLLCSIPKRHSVLFVGDLNTLLPQCLPWISAADPSGRVSEDSSALLEILRTHDLWMCNHREGSLGITFGFPQGFAPPKSGSRIDYAYVRQSSRCRYVHASVHWDSPLVSDTGIGKHGAIRGHILGRWTPWGHLPPMSKAPAIRKHWDRVLLREALISDSALGKRFKALLSERLSQHTCTNIDDLNTVVHEIGMQLFSCHAGSRAQPAWYTYELRKLCHQKWSDWRALKTHSGRSLLSFFLGWRLAVRSQASTYAYTKACRQAKRSWLTDLCNSAKQAMDSQDMATFFSLVNRLAPRCPRKPRQVGRFLEGADDLPSELALLQDHFSELFGAPCSEQCLISRTWRWTSPPSCDNELAHALDHLPISKAVPPSCPLGGVWRLAVSLPEVRALLDEIIQQFPSKGIPLQFTQSTLALIPKANKSGRQVQHLRPIALQCVIGKAILRWVGNELKQRHCSIFLSFPQFAFLPGRTTEQAILRVETFLSRRNALMPVAQPSVRRRRSGHVCKDVVGYLVVSLDLQQAFDRLNRQTLLQALHWFGVSAELIDIIREWHVSTSYVIRHGGQLLEIANTRGVRQGCTAAPTLWVIYIQYVFSELMQCYPDTPWLEYLTLYADDIILAHPIDGAAQVPLSLLCVRRLFEHLEQHSLLINYEKTQVLFRVCGAGSRSHLSRHTRKHNGRRCLAVKPGCLLEIQTSIVYLGVVLAPGRSSVLTMRYRIKQANKNWARLRCWWRCSSLSIRQRCQLYQCTILPCLCYGLGGLGLSQKAGELLTGTVLKQLRHIAGSPAHIFHETNADLLQRLKMPDPLLLVQQACLRLFRQLCHSVTSERCPVFELEHVLQSHMGLVTHWLTTCEKGFEILHLQGVLPLPGRHVPEWLRSIPLLSRNLLSGLIQFRRSKSSRTPMPGGVSSNHVCPTCAYSAPSYHELRRHWGFHPECAPIIQTWAFNPASDCGHDLPVCAWCGAEFVTWPLLKRHCELNRCAEAATRAEWRRNEQQAPSTPARAIQATFMHVNLRTNCVLCGRWCGFPSALLSHISHTHAAQIRKARQALTSLPRWSGVVALPCPFCGVVLKSTKNYDMTRHLKRDCPARLQALIVGKPDRVKGGYLLPDPPSATPHGDTSVPSSRQRNAGYVGRVADSTGGEACQIRRRIRTKTSPTQLLAKWQQAQERQSADRAKRSLGPPVSKARLASGRAAESDCTQQLHGLPLQSVHPRHSATHHCIESGMEGSAGERPNSDSGALAGCDDEGFPRIDACTPSSSQRGQGIASTHLSGHGKEAVSRDCMGPEDISICTSTWGNSDQFRTSFSLAQGSCSSDHARGLGAAEGAASVGRLEQRGHFAHASHDVSYERSGPTIACPSQDVDELQLLATLGCHNESRERQTGATCRDHSQADLSCEGYTWQRELAKIPLPSLEDLAHCQLAPSHLPDDDCVVLTDLASAAVGDAAENSQPLPSEAGNPCFSVSATSTLSSSYALKGGGLFNYANVCYANSVALAWGWTYVVEPEIFEGASEAFMAMLRSVSVSMQGSSQRCSIAFDIAPMDLLRHPAWSSTFARWETGRHEDAAEFISHVLGCCQCPGLMTSLQMRRCAPDASVAFSVENIPAILLSLSLPVQETGQPCQLNTLVDSWSDNSTSEDGSIHRMALIVKNRLLCLHLLRFQNVGPTIRKICSAVMFEETVRIPVWCGDDPTSLHREFATYSVHAVVCHHGTSLDNGHYTAYLCSSAGDYHCDDLTQPRRVDQRPQWLYRDSYIMMLRLHA